MTTVGALVVGGCVHGTVLQEGPDSSLPVSSETIIKVVHEDESCGLSANEIEPGLIRFEVTNAREHMTSLHVLRSDGATAIGSLQDLASNLTRELVVRMAPGSYVLECRETTHNSTLRTPLRVAGVGSPDALLGEDAEIVDAATRSFDEYVRDQSRQARQQSEALAGVVAARDLKVASGTLETAVGTWARLDAITRALNPGESADSTSRAGVEPNLKDPVTLAASIARATDELLVSLDAFTVADPRGIQVPTEMLAGHILAVPSHGSLALTEFDRAVIRGSVEVSFTVYASLRPIVERKDPALAQMLDAHYADVMIFLEQGNEAASTSLAAPVTEDRSRKLASAVGALREAVARIPEVVREVGP